MVQGIYGGGKIVKYLDFVGMGLGFNVVRGSCLTALDPMSEKEQQKIGSILAVHARQFHEQLMKPAYPVPSLFKVWAFHYARTKMRLQLDAESCDCRYYKSNGWFESDYFYPVRLSAFKRAAGRFFDYTTARMVQRA